jgi:pyruvate dehydrogenase E2 component (dihydrolipoamide acetyltransferase)
MPSLGADMVAGTLVEWRIKPGTSVRHGDVVALIDTEKGIIDIESFEDGIVEKLVVQPGTRVPVGATLAFFEGEPSARQAAGPPQAAGPATPAPSIAAPPAAARGGKRISPAARAKAKELGVDVQGIEGTGPQGAVTLSDVERAATGARAAVPAAKDRSGMRNAIAASMSRSKREIPHYYLQLAMDLKGALDWLETFNASRPVPERLLTAVLFNKAAARAAAEKPGFNGFFGPRGFEPASSVHLGVAIALRGGGLVAPAVLNAEQKPLPTLMRELQDLVTRVRAGHMRGSEIASATITVTSLGDEGVDIVYPIIHPPQVAIVGFGSVVERPWVVNGRIEARPIVNVTLAADHRVTDGRVGAQFLARIRDLLMQPADL